LPYERSEDSTDESIDIRIKRKLHMLGHTVIGFILKSISLWFRQTLHIPYNLNVM